MSTGIFTITFTFLKDVAPKHTDASLLEWAWGGYLASILFGLLALMSLAGTIDSSAGTTIYTPGLRVLAGAQALLFFGALIATLVFGIRVA